MSIPHDPLCGVFSMARGFCDMDCAKRQGDDSWRHPPARALSTHLGDGEGEALLAGGKINLTREQILGRSDRERALDRVLAYHENAFARHALEQAQLLLDDNPDRPAMDALNRAMGRHASILAELRR